MSTMNDHIREALKDRRATRDAKLQRVFATPAQLQRTAEGLVISPPGQTPLEAAQREATAARAKADAAKAKAKAKAPA
jgi:hypothetical protein